MKNKFKHGVVFGVFDKFHQGHQFFLKKASEQMEKCTTIVARDVVVGILKNKKPTDSERVRLANVLASGHITSAELGDEKTSTYDVIKRLHPDVICLGYDQKSLEQDLRDKMVSNLIPIIPILVLESHQPDRYHTSLLNDVKRET